MTPAVPGSMSAGTWISQPTLTVEELEAIVDEGDGWRKKVACHAYNGLGATSLDGGCDSIEHGLELSDAKIAAMIKRGKWYRAHIGGLLLRIPIRRTRHQAKARPQGVLSTGVSFKRVECRREDDSAPMWRVCVDGPHRAGVRARRTSHDSDAGDSAATSRAAELLDKRGKLEWSFPARWQPGAVRVKPARRFHVLEKVEFVMKDGAVFKRCRLLAWVWCEADDVPRCRDGFDHGPNAQSRGASNDE